MRDAPTYDALQQKKRKRRRRPGDSHGRPASKTIAVRSGAGAMSDVILETHHLTKEFKGFTAVSDVNLAVQRGSIHALIGPNGAGKTTCFNLLTKFLEPTSGTIV